MLRYGLVGVLVLGLIGTAVVWGGGPPAGMGRTGPAEGMPPQAAMMTGMMMRGDIAAWDGSVFALRGGELMKLDGDLTVVKSVKVPRPGRGRGMGPGGAGQGRAGMTGMQGGRMMGRMQGRMMGGMASLAADSRGVYVLSGSTITVYDHDLTEVRSGHLAAPAEAEEEEAEGEEEAQQGEHPGRAQEEHPAR